MIHEGDHVIIPEGFDFDELTMRRAEERGLFEEVGQRQAELLMRAREGRSGELLTEGEKERLAARRLLARALLAERFPGAGPGMPHRRHYVLTERGRTCWLKVLK